MAQILVEDIEKVLRFTDLNEEELDQYQSLRDRILKLDIAIRVSSRSDIEKFPVDDEEWQDILNEVFESFQSSDGGTASNEAWDTLVDMYLDETLEDYGYELNDEDQWVKVDKK